MSYSVEIIALMFIRDQESGAIMHRWRDSTRASIATVASDLR